MTTDTRDEEHAEEALIAPAPFKPVDETEVTRKRWLKPASALFLTAVIVLLLVVWYVFTARSVILEFNPGADAVKLSGGLSFKVGDSYLLREGSYQLSATAAGYWPLQETLEVTAEQNQRFKFELDKLPGKISFTTTPADTQVLVNGELLGTTPLVDQELAAGEYQITLSQERYLPSEQSLVVEGKHVKQAVEAMLAPAWADVTVSTTPEGAQVLVDGQPVALTPTTIEVLQGERNIALQRAGFKDWNQQLEIVAGQSVELPNLVLDPVDGLIRVSSEPSGANVTINSVFRGKTPIALEVEPDETHQIQLFKSGFHSAKRSLRIDSGTEENLQVRLKPVLGEINVSGSPADAKVYVDGDYKGTVNNVFSLPTQQQRLEVRKSGYETFVLKVTPRTGLAQQVNVKLKTLAQAKWDAIPKVITTAAGQKLRLYRPSGFKMGASRREAGRRANEVLRSVELTRPFYLSQTEVSNEQYRQFQEAHSSGNVKGNSLNGDKQPVVQVSWKQAALYCNWLSEQESLTSAYQVEDGAITGFNSKATGYRLPTEAEWAWAARSTNSGLLKYPWGATLPPTEKSGNYADRSAAFVVGRVVETYFDDYPVTAPVGSFLANEKGLFDLGGNVAEWVNDFYGTTVSLSGAVEKDPIGPEEGKYRVIRGSSWAHGTITELRLSYRDYGTDGRNDVGFRVARFVE